MSLEQYLNYIKKHGVPRTSADGGEIALKRNEALSALAWLTDTETGVLGGDVYVREEDGYFRPTYANWHCDKIVGSEAEFAVRSQQAARDFVMKYGEPKGSDVWYVFVLDD